MISVRDYLAPPERQQPQIRWIESDIDPYTVQKFRK